MTFIKTQNAVMNTSYVVAVRLDNQTIADEKSVSVLLATLQFLLFSGIPSLITKILDFGFWILDYFLGLWLTFFGWNKSKITNLKSKIDRSPQFQESSVA